MQYENILKMHLWWKWQTHRAKNPAGVTAHEGSTPFGCTVIADEGRYRA